MNNISVPDGGVAVYAKRDVLHGRGQGVQRHLGNINYRKLVYLNKALYATCHKKDKAKVVKGIVTAVREHGGRFLELNERFNLFYDIGDAKAGAKTSQALREGLSKFCKKRGIGKMENAVILDKCCAKIPAPYELAKARKKMLTEKMEKAAAALANVDKEIDPAYDTSLLTSSADIPIAPLSDGAIVPILEDVSEPKSDISEDGYFGYSVQVLEALHNNGDAELIDIKRGGIGGVGGRGRGRVTFAEGMKKSKGERTLVPAGDAARPQKTTTMYVGGGIGVVLPAGGNGFLPPGNVGSAGGTGFPSPGNVGSSGENVFPSPGNVASMPVERSMPDRAPSMFSVGDVSADPSLLSMGGASACVDEQNKVAAAALSGGDGGMLGDFFKKKSVEHKKAKARLSEGRGMQVAAQQMQEQVPVQQMQEQGAIPMYGEQVAAPMLPPMHVEQGFGAVPSKSALRSNKRCSFKSTGQPSPGQPS